jgi:hypothetical protein
MGDGIEGLGGSRDYQVNRSGIPTTVEGLIQHLECDTTLGEDSLVRDTLDYFSDNIDATGSLAGAQRVVSTSRFGRLNNIHDFTDIEIKSEVEDTLRFIIGVVAVKNYRDGIKKARSENE